MIAQGLEADVALGVARLDGVHVRERDDRLDEPLAGVAARMRTAAVDREVQAVRALYRRFGVDPTKTRPSSEALLRRVRRGEPLPRVNSAVDVCNWCSLEFQLPYGLYDAARIVGIPTLRVGRPGEAYPGIRKDLVHLEGRLTLADDEGPFGNPTSDSARTMTTPDTSSLLVTVFCPRSLAGGRLDTVLDETIARMVRYLEPAAVSRSVA